MIRISPPFRATFLCSLVLVFFAYQLDVDGAMRLRTNAIAALVALFWFVTTLVARATATRMEQALAEPWWSRVEPGGAELVVERGRSAYLDVRVRRSSADRLVRAHVICASEEDAFAFATRSGFSIAARREVSPLLRRRSAIVLGLVAVATSVLLIVAGSPHQALVFSSLLATDCGVLFLLCHLSRTVSVRTISTHSPWRSAPGDR